MTAEIICVGNELLYGDTLNTNTQFLSQQMAVLGIDVRYQLVVGDNEDDLLEAIYSASKRADVVIFSGGLGPTYDDMTKETVAKALNQKLVMDAEALAAIKGYFMKLGREMKDSNKKQALRLERGRCMPNRNGTAPGIHVTDGGVQYFLLPGPPIELIPMYEEEVKPVLQNLAEHAIASRLYGLAGIGESSIAAEIGYLMDKSDNPRIAPYAKTGAVNIRVTAKSDSAEKSHEMIEEMERKLMPHIGPYLYTKSGEDIESVIVRRLKEKDMTVSAAESCTGGLLSSRIVNVSGASEVFMNSFVTYSNEAKMTWVKVQEALLAEYGAVSEQVAVAMAEGVRDVSKTDFGVGITGIAGPGGGTAEKPVGTVCIAIAGPLGTDVTTNHFSGNREKIRALSAQYALNGLFAYIKKIG